MVYGVFRSIESFDLWHSELCWEREVQHSGHERGFRLLYQSIHGNWGSTLHSLLHMAELLLDVLETLLPRLFPLPLLLRDWLLAFIVPSRHSLIATISGGYIGIMPPGLAILSSFVNASRGVEVFLFLLWSGIAAFTGLLCLRWALYLSGELC